MKSINNHFLHSRYCFIALSILNSLFLFSCTKHSVQNSSEKKLFTLIDPKDSGIHFANNLEFNPKFNIYTYRNFYNGGGVAIGDINKDSLPDIYFSANMGSNKLYLNKGNLELEDITIKAGVEGRRG